MATRDATRPPDAWPERGAPGDEVDVVRIRLAWTAVAVVVGSGLGGVFAAALLEECCSDLGDIVYLPLLAAWSVSLGVVAGRWTFKRTLGAGVALSLLLTWMAAHFLVDDIRRIYPLEWVVDVGGGALGVLLFWAVVGMAMVIALLGIERVVQRVR